MSTFWDRWARFYDLAQRSNRAANAAAAARVAELVPAGARVLDCAAGTGEFSLAAARQASSVLCTDMSLPMLEQARRKAQKRGLTNISFAQRDVTALSDPDAHRLLQFLVVLQKIRPFRAIRLLPKGKSQPLGMIACRHIDSS